MSARIVCAGVCALKQEAQCDLRWWEAALLSQQRSLLHGLWIAEKPTRGALTLNPLNWLLLYYHTSPIPGGNRLSSLAVGVPTHIYSITSVDCLEWQQ